jgi:hypothetical protein
MAGARAFPRELPTHLSLVRGIPHVDTDRLGISQSIHHLGESGHDFVIGIRK